jgi:GMP synthase PP-ATPase subunit
MKIPATSGAVDSDVMDIIIEKSLGNPMFAVKLARAMLETNVCAIEDSRLVLKSSEQYVLRSRPIR